MIWACKTWSDVILSSLYPQPIDYETLQAVSLTVRVTEANTRLTSTAEVRICLFIMVFVCICTHKPRQKKWVNAVFPVIERQAEFSEHNLSFLFPKSPLVLFYNMLYETWDFYNWFSFSHIFILLFGWQRCSTQTGWDSSHQPIADCLHQEWQIIANEDLI